MIYTIGYKEGYDAAIAASPTRFIFKAGRASVEQQREFWEEDSWLDKDYPGGYAFKTKEDAERRIAEAYQGQGFGVYRLMAIWEVDTGPDIDGGWWHNLLIDRPLCALEGSLPVAGSGL